MTEIDVYQPGNGQIAIPARPLDDWIPVVREVVYLAEQIASTPFVPDGLRGSVPAVAAAILTGRELGIPPMTALANVHVIKGKTGLSALLMRAMVLSRGHLWENVEVTDTRVIVRGKRKGETEWTQATFTADQAKRANIPLHPYPADKLYARASVRLARQKFADVIAGMPYSAEELEDGIVDEHAGEPQPASNGDRPAPRTAQRRTTKTQDRGGARGPVASQPGIAVDAAADLTRPAAAGNDPGGSRPDPDLPPLPGEDEPAQPPFDPDEHGTATRGKGGQLTAIWTIFGDVFSFNSDEKDKARGVVEHIIGRKLDGETTGDLSFSEASAVIDTLGNWRKIAESRGQEPRATLIAILAESGKAVPGD